TSGSLEGLKVMGGTIQGSKVGVEVSEKGILKVNGEATIEVQAGGTGLKVEGNGRASVVGGMIQGKGVGKTGVEMSGTAQVTLNMVKVSGVGRGVYMEKGTLKIERGSITGGGSGYGVYAMGGKVTLDGVEISGVEEGVVMMGSGTLTVMGGEIKEFAKYGVYVGDGVTSASLTGTKIVGGGSGVGVYATGGTVRLEGVTVSRVMTGVKVEGKGSLTVGKGSVEFKGAHGVYVGSEVKS
ncbi:right-handed parallel beta-helix repeat-containing protein, partial [Helicobacter pylori]